MAVNRIDPPAPERRPDPPVRPPAPPNRTAQAASAEASRPAAPIGDQVRSAPEARVPRPQGEAAEIPVRQARLRIDDETRRVITQIVDENEEVVKQIPAEEVLRIAARFRRLQGLLFDETT